MSPAQRLYLQGLALQRQAQLGAAVDCYRQALELEPAHFGALHMSAVIAAQAREPQRAARLFKKALRVNPWSAAAHSNYGNLLEQQGRLREALRSYERALALKPDHATALSNRGSVLTGLGQHEAALSSLDEALARHPDHADAHNNRGLVLKSLKRYREALESLDRAIALQPRQVAPYVNRASALHALGEQDAALRDLDHALALRSDNVEALSNRALVLLALRRRSDALRSAERAVALAPERAEAHRCRGIVRLAADQHQAALQSLDRAVELQPKDAEAHHRRGLTLQALQRHEAAWQAFERARALDPHLDYLLGSLLAAKQQRCDWDGLDALLAEIEERIGSGHKACRPLTLVAALDAPDLQRRCAEAAVERLESAPAERRWRPGPDGKIRIGYFSPDLREHPVYQLTAELFERHDRARFEVIAFSNGEAEDAAIRRRVQASFDELIDVRTLGDREIAQLARDKAIAIAVDLAGHTEHGLTQSLADRAAPIQVNYLGYPGTLGAGFIDYLIADRWLIPAELRPHYREKVVSLPHSYQANDRQRRIAPTPSTRAEQDLPAGGFVFCCLHRHDKLTPAVFDCWTRILRQAPDALLWLLDAHAQVKANLRREAERHGVAGERLRFAPRMPNPAEHLARLALADLMLDTLPYNGHTTASEALWAGLPVLSCAGKSFASRVGASLLAAIELPELITRSLDEYERLAVELATQPAKRAAIRQRLAANRLTTPLFDSARFTRDLETAYAQMRERHRQGLPPEHIEVPA